MNKVILMGRLTRDPELRYSNTGQAVCRYSLAVNRSYKRDGEPDADFINIVAFGGRGECAGKYFHKGMMVAICGELRVSSYEQNGTKRYSTDVIATDQYFAESKASYESRSQRGGNFAPGAPSGGYQNYQAVPPQNNAYASQNNTYGSSYDSYGQQNNNNYAPQRDAFASQGDGYAPQNDGFASQGNGYTPQNDGFVSQPYESAPPQPQSAAQPAGPDGFTPVDATLEGDSDLPF